MAGEKEECQQAHAAQQRPQQHDLPAVKGNMAGNNTIEAEQKKGEKKAEKKTVLLIHGYLLRVKKRRSGGEKKGAAAAPLFGG